MFERFTDQARRVVVLAQEEARKLDHNYIGTEHILLGLIHQGDGDESVAAEVLASLNVSLETVRHQVETIIGQGQATPSGHIPFTPRAKKVLELSLREALQLGHNYIGTEHILLGLIREGDGVAAQVLSVLGVDLELARRTVLALLEGKPLPSAESLTRSMMEHLADKFGIPLGTIEEARGILSYSGASERRRLSGLVEFADKHRLNLIELARFVRDKGDPSRSGLIAFADEHGLDLNELARFVREKGNSSAESS